MPTQHTLLTRLYDEHSGALYAFLLNLTKRESDARDLLQEVFVKLATRLDQLERVRCERAFLLQTCYRLGIDRSRRQRARAEYEDEFVTQSGAALFAKADDPDTDAFRIALGTALLDLPIDQRNVVHLKLWQGLTFQSIADTLEIPLNTATSRYRYGIDKLRERLRPIYEEIRV